MKGGFNKILRNIVAGSSDTEFEKVRHPLALKPSQSLTIANECAQRLTKATFHLDSKEPKEKHVICKYTLH